MYQKAYQDIAGEDYSAERNNEALALDHAINLMKEGEAAGMDSVEAVKAAHFVRRLWFHFLDDLTMPENGLPDELKANLISIGIWILRELDRMGEGEGRGFGDIMEIMGMIKKGLTA